MLLLPSLALAQEAGEATLTLGPGPAENLLALQLGALGFTDSQSTQISGDIDVSLEIDPATGKVLTIEFTDGELSASDVVFSLAFGAATASTSGIKGTVDTPGAPGAVDGDTQKFSAAEHRITFNQGQLMGDALGNSFSTDFSTSPTEWTGNGDGEVTVTEVSRTATRIIFDVDLALPVIDTQTETYDGIEVELTLTGTLTASGQVFVYRSAYLQWTEENGIAGAAFTDDFGPGAWTNGLTWAMRSSRVPWSAASNGALSLDLPAAGTRGALVLEQSTDLSNWIPALGSQIVGGEIELPAGSTGKIELVSPSVDRYFRVRAIEP